MKGLFIIPITLMLLLAIGCSGGDKNNTAAGSKFIGGTEGLSISFAPGSLPDKVLDKDQPFAVTVVVTNKGDHTIDNVADATVRITGIDPVDFGVSASDLVQDSPTTIRGAQKDLQGQVIQGETISLDFPGNGANLQHQKEIAGAVTYNIRADICYKYGTVANTKLCVLQDILGTKSIKNQLCTVTEDKVVDNSGGPVQVAAFRESASSSSMVSFLIKLKHVGTGTIHEAASECNQDFQKKDKVHIKIDTGLSDGLTCSGLQNGAATGSIYEGDAQLLSGEREVRCTQTVNNPVDLEKLVTVELTYDYDQFITKPLEVQHVG